MGNAVQCLDSHACAALGAARIDDGTAAGGFHAHEKTMCLLAAGHGGLIGTFHDQSCDMPSQWLDGFVEKQPPRADFTSGVRPKCNPDPGPRPMFLGKLGLIARWNPTLS